MRKFESQGRNSKSKNNRQLAKAFRATILLVAIIVVCNTLAGCDTSSLDANSDSALTNSQEQTNHQQIYEDSDVRVSFIGLTDSSELGISAELKACYINLKVENISDKSYTVMLTDAYANDSAVTIMSGVPMTLAPGKNSQAPFVFGYNNIVNSVDDIQKLEFKITLLVQDASSTLKTSETIVINF